MRIMDGQRLVPPAGADLDLQQYTEMSHFVPDMVPLCHFIVVQNYNFDARLELGLNLQFTEKEPCTFISELHAQSGTKNTVITHAKDAPFGPQNDFKSTGVSYGG